MAPLRKAGKPIAARRQAGPVLVPRSAYCVDTYEKYQKEIYNHLYFLWKSGHTTLNPWRIFRAGAEAPAAPAAAVQPAPANAVAGWHRMVSRMVYIILVRSSDQLEYEAPGLQLAVGN